MNRVNPKEAAVFIIVLLTIASVINGLQDPRRNERTDTPLPTRPPISPQPREVRNDVVAAPPVVTAPSPSVSTIDYAEQRAHRAAQEASAAAQRVAEKAAADHARFLAKYVNPSISRKPGTRVAALVIVAEDEKLNPALSAVLVHRFKTNSLEILTSLFKSAFVSDGLFNATFGDPNKTLTELELTGALDVLLFGRQKVQYSANPALENVITANMDLELVAFPANSSVETRRWRFTANGAGFKQELARSMAEERLIKQITSDTKMSLSSLLTND